MSYAVSSKKYPIAADINAVGTFLAQRQSDSATTNGGIVASGGSAAVPQLGVDAPGLGAAYMAAQADAIMCAAAYQAQDVAFGTAVTTSSTTFTAVYSSYSFTAPIAKTYLVHVDVQVGAQAFNGGGLCSAYFLLLVGVTPYSLYPGVISMTSTTPYYFGSYRVPVPMSVGANSLQLMWKVDASQTANLSTSTSRVFTVTG